MLERARHNLYKILESFDCLPSIYFAQYEIMRIQSPKDSDSARHKP